MSVASAPLTSWGVTPVVLVMLQVRLRVSSRDARAGRCSQRESRRLGFGRGPFRPERGLLTRCERRCCDGTTRSACRSSGGCRGSRERCSAGTTIVAFAGGRYEYYHLPRRAQPTICPGPADPAEISFRSATLSPDRRMGSVRTSCRLPVHAPRADPAWSCLHPAGTASLGSDADSSPRSAGGDNGGTDRRRSGLPPR